MIKLNYVGFHRIFIQFSRYVSTYIVFIEDNPDKFTNETNPTLITSFEIEESS